MVTINRALNDYEHLKKVHQLVQMDLALADSSISHYKEKVSVQQNMLDLQDKRFKEQTLFYDDLLKSKDKKSRKRYIGVGVGGTLLGIVLGVLLSK